MVVVAKAESTIAKLKRINTAATTAEPNVCVRLVFMSTSLSFVNEGWAEGRSLR
jgi:hypothetical protein